MNNNNSILLLDPAFDPDTASSCNLLVKIGLNSFAYAIINKINNQVNAVFDEQECENVLQQLADRLKTDPYLTLSFQQVKIAVHTANQITIPNELYERENIEVHSKFFTPPYTENLYTQTQGYFDFTTIFTLPKATEDILNTFTDAKKYQQNAGLLALAEKTDEPALFLDFTVGYFNVLYLKDQKIVFQQSYEIDHIEEFNYYVLLMVNQLKINTKTTVLNLSGIIHEGDDKYNCLLKYFTVLQFVTVDDELDQTVLDDMPAHYYTNLLALDQCV